MNISLSKSLDGLKSAIENDERIIRLNELEKKLYDDPSLLELVKKKDDLEREYNTVLSYKDKDSDEAKRVGKALHDAKMELDTYPLAKEYSEAYIAVRDLYMQIDDIIFGPYRKKTLSSKAK
jgi:cell fate (sporulation/competence/biofilm development) regulator YmcA (YheA/YmcA/DUF963 family)